MVLNDEQRNKLFEQLKSKGQPPNCSICGKNNWSVSDTIFELREFQGGNLIVGKGQNIYPVLPLTCLDCGQTIFLNPIILGILDPQKSGGQ